MSIQLPDQILAKFAQGQWREGISLYAQSRMDKAMKNLCEVPPADPVAVAKLQEEIRQLSKLESIESAVIKFEENKAASKLTEKRP